MKNQNAISIATLKRLPLYLSYLRAMPKDGHVNISSTTIASALGLNDVQVRKDLAAVGEGGKPKIGYFTEDLIADIENCLGYRDFNDAALVGVGNLGKALLSYEGFSDYGVNIVVAFDKNEELKGVQICGKHILPMDKMEDLCTRMKIKIGIIAVPEAEAQLVCDSLVSAGALAIWNFAPVRLRVPETVMVLDEHIGSALPSLRSHLAAAIN